jgi:hypothetical protein
MWNFVSHIEGRTQTVFENRMLRRMFGPKRGDEVAGEDCVMRSCRVCDICERDEKCIQSFRKPEGQRTLGRPRQRWMMLEGILESKCGRQWTGFI